MRQNQFFFEFRLKKKKIIIAIGTLAAYAFRENYSQRFRFLRRSDTAPGNVYLPGEDEKKAT